MTTTWTERTEVSTNRTPRKKPSIYIAPLQDAYVIVHNEDNEIVYIISNTWEEVVFTDWTTRPVLND